MSDVHGSADIARRIVLAAFKILLPDVATRVDGLSDIADILLRGRDDKRARKTLIHRLEESTDFLAERLERFEAVEFGHLDGGEKHLAISGVYAALSAAGLTVPEVAKNRIDPYRLYNILEPHARSYWATQLLSDAAVGYGERYLEVTCLYTTTVVREMPELTIELLTQIYDATEKIHQLLQKSIATVVMPRFRQGLPDEVSAFEAIYRSDIIQTYKDMELFGLTGIPPEFCHQPIEVSYITLRANISQAYSRPLLSQAPDSSDGRSQGRASRVDAAFHSVLEANTIGDMRGARIPNPSKGTRILLTGPAGSGKTTVARWLAIRAAQHKFPEILSQWNRSIPFFVPLRNVFQGYRRRSPTESDLIQASSQRSSGEMPGDWIKSHLRNSSLIILDGVDELSDLHKSDFRIWVEKLERDYPLVHIIITSRPDGIDHGWFNQRGYTQLELQPMELPEIHLSIRRWFRAVIAADKRNEALYSDRKKLLLKHLQERSAVHELAETPLVCAMLCAFYSYNLSDSAPKSRGELYQRVINALVHEREEARLLENARLANISLGTKLTLLQAVARHMTEGVLSSIPCFPVPDEFGLGPVVPVQDETAKDVLVARLRGMTPPGVSVEELLHLLLERSIVFRKVGPNEAAFVHRSLQEYLTASDYADNGAVDELLHRSDQSNWRNILAFAASKLSVPAASRLVDGLLDRAGQQLRDDQEKRELLLLAAQCYGSAKRIKHTVSQRADRLMKQVLPPRDFAEAELVSFAGEDILPWLADRDEIPMDIALYSMRASALVGGPKAMTVLANYAQSRLHASEVADEILHDWQYFDASDYVRRVLSCTHIADRLVTLDTAAMVKAAGAIEAARRIRVNPPHAMPDFDSWGRMTDLEDLDWPNSSVLTSCEGIASLTGLCRLRLSGAVNLMSINGIEKLVSLRELYLAGCISIQDISPLSRLPALRALILDNCDRVIEFKSLSELSPSLKMLSLNGCKLDSLEFCASLEALRRLVAVTHDGIRDTSALHSAVQLRRLDIKLAAAAVREEIHMPDNGVLEELYLSGDVRVGDLAVVGHYPNLRTLCVGKVGGLETLASLSGLRKLRRLEVTDCDDLYDASAIEMTTMLERLSLSGSSIANLDCVRGMSSLRELHLADCRYLTDLSALEALPALEYIDLTGTAAGVIPEGIEDKWASDGKVVIVRDSFDMIDMEADGGFYGPTG